jgi:hypothetical protein
MIDVGWSRQAIHEAASPPTPGINEHFLTHRSSYELATLIVYTADRTAEETCAEILQRIAVLPDGTSP